MPCPSTTYSDFIQQIATNRPSRHRAPATFRHAMARKRLTADTFADAQGSAQASGLPLIDQSREIQQSCFFISNGGAVGTNAVPCLAADSDYLFENAGCIGCCFRIGRKGRSRPLGTLASVLPLRPSSQITVRSSVSLGRQLLRWRKPPNSEPPRELECTWRQ